MKNIYLFILTAFILNINVFSQEYIFKFNVGSKDELSKLTKLISIDNYSKGEVIAYANKMEMDNFKTLGYDYELIPNYYGNKSLTMASAVGEMINWDRYPTHDLYIQMMDQFELDFPNLCRIDTIGTSEDGRPIKVAKITDNPDIDEEEPEFFYTGTMHGDELAGYVLLLRLIDYLLTNYGTDTRVTNLINNCEIWINPLANPDGTFAGGNNTVSSSTRSNTNGIDLNRNFPTPDFTPGSSDQKEIQAMIKFAENHHFVFSANTHGGAEVVNYPWDTWYSNEKTHSDHNWFDHVSHNYADSVHVYSPSTYLDGYDNGVTHGADWYKVYGSRQDHMTYYQQCREITLELSNAKRLDCEDLPAHWNYNRSAFLGFIEECLYGFNGTVKNISNDPLDAKIEIFSHDVDSSLVYTDPAKGDYYRPIEPGTYSVNYSSTGYTSQQHIISVTDWETATIKNVILRINPDLHSISGTVVEDITGNPLENVIIEILDLAVTPENTNISGQFTINDIEIGSYQIRASKENYLSDTVLVEMTGENEIINFTLRPNVTITGTIIDNVSGDPIPGVKVEILNSGLSVVETNSSGQYMIESVPQTTQLIKVCKLNYDLQEIIEDVSTSNTIFNFSLKLNDAINFETVETLDEFSFAGSADWTREFGDFPECNFGEYAVRSGDISNNQTSEILVTKAVFTGTLSFYKKVSSERSYDFLRFYIDDVLQNSWSGEIAWSEETYQLVEGTYTFKWLYSKDGNTSNGEDAAWIDLIDFPLTDSSDIIVQKKNLLVYPNPGMGVFTVRCNELIKDISITDITGKLLNTYLINSNNADLNISEKGFFLLHIKTNTNIFYEKIIIR